MAWHPLIAPALALNAGILAAAWLEPPAWPLLGAALFFLAWSLALAWRRGRFAAWPLAGLMFFLGGGLYVWTQLAPLPPDHLAHQSDGRAHTVVFDAASAPEPGSHNPRIMALARSLDGEPVRGRFLLSINRHLEPPPMGARVKARLKMRRLVSFANPGGFDYAAYMASKGIHARAYAGKSSGLKVLGPGDLNPVRTAIENARARLGAMLDQLTPGQGRELLRALILGQRGGLKTATRDAFAGIGAAHLLAISGLHLGMVWGLGFLLLRLLAAAWPGLALRIPAPKLAALGALIPCAAYAALAGASTPTLRALVMAICLAAALWFNRPYYASGALALAALVIGLLWPGAPLTLSFQLSFTAVAAILLAAVPLAGWLKDRGPWGGILGGLAGWLGLSAVVALAVWPLTVLHFHQVPLMSLPANALLVPLVGMLTLPLALLGAGLGLVHAPAGAALLGLAVHPAAWAVELARYLAAVPGAVRFVAGPGPWAVLLIYASALAFLLLRRWWRWGLGAALGAAALALWVVGTLPTKPDGALRVWVLDVGQGSATVARLPDGRAMVIDGGGWPGSDFDFGRKVLAPFLWSRHIYKVSVVANSHPDQDHTQGLAFVARWFDPDEIWTNGGPPAKVRARLMAVAKERGIRVRAPADLPPEQELGGAVVRVVWPPPGGAPPGAGNNDRSLWLGLGLDRAFAWLPGDAGPGIERRLADALKSSGPSIIAAPHHGGKGSLTPELLASLRPQVVAVSAGCYNRYRMPNQLSMQRARKIGARVLTTRRWGALELWTFGGPWRVKAHLRSPRACP